MGSGGYDDDYRHLSGSKLSGQNDFFDMEDDHTDHNVRDIEYKPKIYKKSSAEIARDLIAKEAASKPKPLTLEERNRVIRETQENHNFQERNAKRTAEFYAHAAENPIKSTVSRLELENTPGAGKLTLDKNTAAFGSHENRTGDRRPSTYIVKASKPTRLTNINFSKYQFEDDLKKSVSRQVNLKALVSTEYFTGKFSLTENTRALTPEGQGSLLGRVNTLVTAQRAFYLGYLSQVEKLLDNPRIPISTPGQVGKKVTRGIAINVPVGNKTYTPKVAVTWDALSKRKLDEVKAGTSANTFWKNSGKLAKAFKRNVASHKSKIKYEDYYDKAKLDQQMQAFRTTQQVKDLSNTGKYGDRQAEVKFSVDLTVPKWQATNGDLMDTLITQPYNNPFDHLGSTGNSSNGLGRKVSSFFRARKKQKEFYADFEGKVNDHPQDRYEANRVIKNTPRDFGVRKDSKQYLAAKKEEQAVDSKAQSLRVSDFRNAFYNIHNVGGKEVGVRRLINPEFRRPLLQKLSHAAGVMSRQALKDLIPMS